jgi:CDGSH-type Zn-finger protein
MAATKVTVFNNGPVIIEGDFSIHDAGGGEFGLAGRTKIGLCRCGLSSKKPFCDGTHGREGFSSECVAYDLPEPVKKA